MSICNVHFDFAHHLYPVSQIRHRFVSIIGLASEGT
jgi:hypothetical protein